MDVIDALVSQRQVRDHIITLTIAILYRQGWVNGDRLTVFISAKPKYLVVCKLWSRLDLEAGSVRALRCYPCPGAGEG